MLLLVVFFHAWWQADHDQHVHHECGSCGLAVSDAEIARTGVKPHDLEGRRDFMNREDNKKSFGG